MNRSANVELPVVQIASNNVLKSTYARRRGQLADKLVATLLLLLILPLLLLLALIIKLDSSGPVLFRQTRLGYRGKIFTFFKMRTMYENNEDLLTAYLTSRPERLAEWRDYAKLKGYDPRVTRVGRWLRKFSLNEIPQLINVIKGEMRLVGPRPYLLEELPVMGEQASIILSVVPGLTGFWQVSGRSEIPLAERVEMEAWYVRHRSWRLDLLIMLKTIPAVLSRRGAY